MSSEGIVGQVLDGKYSIERQLGKGGMGTVYLSTHIGTGRPVAVKVIAPEFMKRAEFVERFRREAKAAGRLRHPNVVDVTDFGFSKLKSGEDAAYLVMEYLDGCTLGEVLDEEKKLPVEFTIDILEQVCSAVEEAHKQGIIHRDLKPDNIWLEPNLRGGYTVKVLDFGIAKLEETQLEEIAESVEIPYEGSTNTKAVSSKNTIAENSLSETVTDKKNSTIVSENATMALVEESETLAADNTEAGTMIQQNDSNPDINSEAGTQIIQPIEQKKEISLEDGTVILPANQTQAIGDNDDPKGTQIISDNLDTDKSLKRSSSTTNLTKVGAVLGTPLYMSPEQCRGEKLTQHSDIYSLAVIAYQMLSGKLPFTGDYVKVMNGHKHLDAPELKAKKTPKKLKGIVMQSLSKEISERPKTAEAFASKLRANSEGLGVLLRRATVIYSERLPKFLSLAFLTFLPLIILTFARVGFSFLRGFGVIENNTTVTFITGGFGLITFFVQIVTSAFLVGMTTWIVAQTLAYPLRPVSLRAAFEEVKKRWKPLTGTVTASTLLAMFGLALCFFPGVYLSARFMLIAPSIMMEKVSGKSAFKRSSELTKRSFKTVFATAFLVYVIPIALAITIGLSVGSIINNLQMRDAIYQMKKDGVAPMTEEELKKEQGESISITRKGVLIEKNKNKNKKEESEEKSMSKGLIKSLNEGIFELIWTPLALLISSFTSVITALIYFKTRQAGGESMQELLGKLDDADQPQSKWQQRVRERLIQSGKITGSTTNPSKP